MLQDHYPFTNLMASEGHQVWRVHNHLSRWRDPWKPWDSNQVTPDGDVTHFNNSQSGVTKQHHPKAGVHRKKDSMPVFAHQGEERCSII